ncbi:MAG: cytochrome c, partial [Vicinamibacterales bacterium]
MASTSRIVLAGSLVVWGTAFVSVVAHPFERVRVAQPFRAANEMVQTAAQKTTNDGIYTKAQADGARAQFEKICAACHPFTVAAKKKPKDVPLGDEPFFENWEGRSLDAIVTTIVLTMPNDGSGVVTDAEAVDLVAYILQQNGFP